jgi:hypothetical protein
VKDGISDNCRLAEILGIEAKDAIFSHNIAQLEDRDIQPLQQLRKARAIEGAG